MVHLKTRLRDKIERFVLKKEKRDITVLYVRKLVMLDHLTLSRNLRRYLRLNIDLSKSNFRPGNKCG